VTRVVSAESDNSHSGSVSCGPHEEAVGGGYTATPVTGAHGFNGVPEDDESTPATQGAVPRGWQAALHLGAEDLTVYAVCATADITAAVQTARKRTVACPA
jgi:hypothetical protein